MKFYLLMIATGDAKIAGKSVYEFATLKEAVASFHTKLGSAMNSELYETSLLMVINSEGGIHNQETYKNESYGVTTEEPAAE